MPMPGRHMRLCCLVGIWGCVERGMVGGASWWRLLGGCFVLAATALHSASLHCTEHCSSMHCTILQLLLCTRRLHCNALCIELYCNALTCIRFEFSFNALHCALDLLLCTCHLHCIALHSTHYVAFCISIQRRQFCATGATVHCPHAFDIFKTYWHIWPVLVLVVVWCSLRCVVRYCLRQNILALRGLNWPLLHGCSL